MVAPSSSLPSITSFFSSPEQVSYSLQSSAAFRDFHGLAMKNSGLEMRHLDPSLASYRVADTANGVRENLGWENTVVAGEQVLSLRELLTPQCGLERDQLIHALWSLVSFAQVKAFLRELQALVRYGHDEQGQLQAQVLLAHALIPMIEVMNAWHLALLAL